MLISLQSSFQQPFYVHVYILRRDTLKSYILKVWLCVCIFPFEFFPNEFAKFAKSCYNAYFLHQVPKTEIKMFLVNI